MCDVRYEKVASLTSRGSEDVRVADAELVHVAENPLLHVVHVARPRRAVAAVGEEVRVQLVAAREVVVAASHVDRVVARRGRQRHDRAASPTRARAA